MSILFWNQSTAQVTVSPTIVTNYQNDGVRSQFQYQAKAEAIYPFEIVAGNGMFVPQIALLNQVKPSVHELSVPIYPLDGVEIVTLDKWFKPESIRFNLTPLTTAQIVDDPYQLTLSERITLDKYWQRASEPRWIVSPLVQEGYFTKDLNTFGEVISVDKWFKETEKPRWFRQPLVQEGYFSKDLISRGEVISVDKWFKETERTLWTHKPLVREGAFVIDPRQLTQAEQTTIDRYWQQLTEPVRKRAELVREGLFVRDTQAEFPLNLDKWFGRYPDPYFAKTPLVKEGHWSFDVQSEFRVNLDKWFRETEQPPKKHKPLVAEGLFTIDSSQLTASEYISLDKWFKDLEKPRWTKQPLLQEGLFVNDFKFVTDEEIVTLDKYWKQLELPRFVRKPLVREGLNITDAQSEFPLKLQWMSAVEEPLRVKPVLVPEGDFKFDPQAEFRINLDKWFRELATPPKGVKPNVPEGLFVIDASQLTVAERITLDKWFKETEKPRWYKTPLVPEGYFSIDPNQLTQAERATLDKWFKETEKPRWVKQPLVSEGSFGKDWISRGEDISLDKWFKEAEKPRWIRQPLISEGHFSIDASQLTQAEYASLDKWFKETEKPRWRREPLVQEGHFSVDPYLLTQAEFTSVDRWFKELEKPYFDIKRNQFIYPGHFPDRLFVSPGQEVITLDKYFVYERFRPTKAIPFIYEGSFTHTGIVSFVVGQSGNYYLDFEKHRVALNEGTQPITYAQQEIVTLDKFFKNLETPQKGKLLNLEQFVIDPYQLTLGEYITLDKYWKQAEEPVRVMSQLVKEGIHSSTPEGFVVKYAVGSKSSFYLVLKELPNLDYTVTPITTEDASAFADKWLRNTDIPVKEKEKRPSGWFDIDASQLTQTERITLDKYFRMIQEPLRLRPELVREGDYASNIYPIVFGFAELDKWFRETEQPPKTLKPNVKEGWSTVDPNQLTQAERATLDKWFKDNNVIFKPKTFDDYRGVSGLRLDELITLDKWYRPLSKPKPAIKYPLAQSLAFEFTPFENITLDRWYRETFVPVVLKQKHQEEFSKFTPTEQEQILGLGWLPGFIELTRSKEYRTQLINVLSMVEIGEQPLTDLDWLVETNKPYFAKLNITWLQEQYRITNELALFILRTMCLDSVAIILALAASSLDVFGAVDTNDVEVIPAAKTNSADVIEAVVASSADVIPAAGVTSIDSVEAVVTDLDAGACKDE